MWDGLWQDARGTVVRLVGAVVLAGLSAFGGGLYSATEERELRDEVTRLQVQVQGLTEALRGNVYTKPAGETLEKFAALERRFAELDARQNRAIELLQQRQDALLERLRR